ncbi:hypothetical protein EYF80_047791 [Liparis tanakae]|uniref:Uncharacterized protein n=1 Tax=Liparis tanakae TaxID=230148 RepID=A0A4Z2FML9_9TELE|nr:hypothetical protein EYF80_047791 [Liparis tanakae]
MWFKEAFVFEKINGRLSALLKTEPQIDQMFGRIEGERCARNGGLREICSPNCSHPGPLG